MSAREGEDTAAAVTRLERSGRVCLECGLLGIDQGRGESHQRWVGVEWG